MTTVTGARRRDRAGNPVTITRTQWSQAQALKRPVAASTAAATGAGCPATPRALRLSTRKDRAIQAAERAGGRRRHHPPSTPP